MGSGWFNGGVRLILTCVSPLTSLAEILTSIKFSGEGLWREWCKDTNSIHYRLYGFFLQPLQTTRRILCTPADDSPIKRNPPGDWNLRIAPTFFLEPGCWTELRKQSLFCYLFKKVKHHHKNRAYISRNLQAACRKISWRFKKRRPRIHMAEWSLQSLLIKNDKISSRSGCNAGWFCWMCAKSFADFLRRYEMLPLCASERSCFLEFANYRFRKYQYRIGVAYTCLKAD